MVSLARNQGKHEEPEEPELGPPINEELPSSSKSQKSKSQRGSVSTSSIPSKPEEDISKKKRDTQK